MDQESLDSSWTAALDSNFMARTAFLVPWTAGPEEHFTWPGWLAWQAWLALELGWLASWADLLASLACLDGPDSILVPWTAVSGPEQHSTWPGWLAWQAWLALGLGWLAS